VPDAWWPGAARGANRERLDMTESNMRRRAVIAAGAAAVPLLAAGGVALAQAPAGPATPTELVRQFQAAMTARDIEGVARLYAEQGVMLTPQGGAIAGRDRIRATLARNLAAGQPALRLLRARFDGGTDAGVVIWEWEVEGADPAPPARRQRVRSMVYVKSSPGGWQIVADMFQVFAAPPG
jgi:uncharacterized protein (TIGR02246 family)